MIAVGTEKRIIAKAVKKLTYGGQAGLKEALGVLSWSEEKAAAYRRAYDATDNFWRIEGRRRMLETAWNNHSL